MDYSTQFTEIQNTLDKCDTIQSTYNHSTSPDSDYPAVVYFPADIENSFATVADNQKIYRWKLFVIVGVEQTTVEHAQRQVLAGAVDDVIDQFDTDWDGGTINGHRASVLIDTGTWGVSETEKSKTVFAELNLRIKVNTSTN